ncbi:MAG: GTPase HflX [Chloroflexota bacterium]|nr:GTPase HflX [Chloroflexota bacterium]
MQKSEKALLLIANIQQDKKSLDYRIEEILNLCDTGKVDVEGVIVQNLKKPLRSYIGSGKLNETKREAKILNVDLIIVDDELSPNQQKYLEDFFKIKVLDRTALILDIFASRARSKEGRLQVSLAQMEFLLPRLAGQWSHLERLGGGIGTRGPGETQIETDRRLVRNSIKKIKKDLEKVRISRNTQRNRRIKNLFNISLVGYTNAGKSTIFELLTRKNSASSNRLFSTLDTKVGKVFLGTNVNCTISDTVGFVDKLPTVLVDAFKATLEELKYSNLLLHIVDCSNPYFDKQIEVVNQLLDDLGLEKKEMIYVFNKIDRLDEDGNQSLKEKIKQFKDLISDSIVLISSKEEINIDELNQIILKHIDTSYNRVMEYTVY